MIIKWKLASNPPETRFVFTDAERIDDIGGKLTFVNPYKCYESSPCIVRGRDANDGKLLITTAIYNEWRIIDARGVVLKTESGWFDYLTEEIPIDVEVWMPLSEMAAEG